MKLRSLTNGSTGPQALGARLIENQKPKMAEHSSDLGGAEILYLILAGRNTDTGRNTDIL
jgi:hypothetical protein